ncbi:MAG: hypothetical protein JWM12_3548, partial [Ilumatobacteraceae bacterium]|nr:hypothetical protein [Ilumatobacteraceae bacterium]
TDGRGGRGGRPTDGQGGAPERGAPPGTNHPASRRGGSYTRAMSSDLPGRWGDGEPAQGSRLPGITVAAAASLGAGAVHAAAAGVHADHAALARIFVVLAAAQLTAGVLAMLRPSRVACWVIAAVNTVAVGGWLLTRVAGINWIDGLQVRESPQFADTACAALGAIAVGTAASAALIGWHRVTARRPATAALPALAVIALALPAMLFGGTAAHSPTAGAATVPTTSTHEHSADTSATTTAPDSGVTPTTFDESQPHQHDANGNRVPVGATTTVVAAAMATDGTPLRPWPRPWDPTQPIDVGGVAGVTAEQEARATTLIERTLSDLPKYADPDAAILDGYTSIGDAATGDEHYIKSGLIQDDDMLDPSAPESLVYKVDGEQRTLAGAMYIVSTRALDDPSLTSYAGSLMTWHEHNNLCWGVGADGAPKVVGLTDADGNCARGVQAGGDTPMVHVWIVPAECGVFSALEGVGAGSTAVPEDQRTDQCASAHDHGSGTTPSTDASTPTTTPARTAPATTVPSAVPSLSYDPSKPIDLGGVGGVTPEQQAAAENLVAINVVRLPQWSDVTKAQAAGYHSIGDAGTGYEHYVDWNAINDDVWLDPDHPESLVYQPQPDGSRKLVSAMYMLPDAVALTDVPNIGGALMQWHIHDNLCFTTDPVAPQVAGLTNANGTCRAGLQTFPHAPMIHVWIVPNKCGPFAALDGLAAGQVAPGETQQCDHVHGDGLLG